VLVARLLAKLLACVIFRDMSGEEQGVKKRPHKVLKAVLVVLGALVVLGIIGNLASHSASATKAGGSSASARNSSSSSQVAEATSVPGFNQSADDGKFRFIATALKCGQTYLVNDSEFEDAHAQGQWCLLSLDISNVGSEAQEFDSSSQYVYDASGKQYSADSNGTMAANHSGNLCISYQQINPGVSSSCVVAFDIPKGAVVTYAKLHDSSVSDGVKVALQ
jgi:Domain of unknown function (DUF4352)